MLKTVPQEYQYKIDDHYIATLTWGEPSHPLLLCIHGWLDNAASFWRLAPLLKNYFVVAVDLMGQGHSEELGEVNMENYFEKQAALISKLITKISAQKKAVIVAHSVGTLVANYLAINFPSRVSQLVFIDAMGLLTQELSHVPGPLKEMLVLFLLTERSSKKIYPSLKDMVDIRMRLNSLAAFMISPLVERGALVTKEGYEWSYDTHLSLRPLLKFSEKQACQLLSKIRSPVLLIMPSNGISAESIYFEDRRKAFKKLSIASVKKAGHHVHLSHPKTVARLIQEFLEIITG